MAALEQDRKIVTAVRQLQTNGLVQDGGIPSDWIERGSGFLSTAARNLEILVRGISITQMEEPVLEKVEKGRERFVQ